MKKVLVVDDREDNRMLVRMMLVGLGLEVHEARHGGEALDLARSQPPDLVISDLLMPVMDGYTFLRAWKTDPALATIPFLVYTATYVEPQDEQLALDLGADAFIRKPEEPETFIARIQALVSTERTAWQAPIRQATIGEEVVVRAYNEVLVRKLEKRSQQLSMTMDALRSSEARLRAILDAEPGGVLLATSDGRVLEINQTGLDLLEAGRMADLSQGLARLAREEKRQAFLETLASASAGQPARIELECMGLKGRWRWLEWFAAPFQKTDAERGGATVCIFQDATVRRTAEEALRKTTERLQLAVATGKVGLWDWDMLSRRVVFSPEWKRQLGYETDEITSSFDEWERRLHPDDYQAALARLNAFLDGDATEFRSEFRLRHKNGSWRQILSRASVVRDAQGKRVNLIGSHVDITEFTELQAQLMQAQKMESIGRLAGGVAHDFNNLLTVINGTADLALSNLGADDPMTDALTDIRQAGQRAANLTRQLLAFSRRQMLKPRPLDLNEIIQGMWTMLRRLINEQVELAFSPGKPMRLISADPGQIEQVIVNLLVNSQDAMPSGGRILVETREVSLDKEQVSGRPSMQQGPHVMLAISDTGVGMDEPTRRHIFEPFFTTKEQGLGTGLGLATVYGIVKQSGGSVWVYSEVGKGTTFKIYLPVHEGHRLPEAVEAATEVPGGRETLLVVEDDAAVREVSRRVLESAGYKVFTAANGREALSHFQATPIELMLTDVVMPGMSGRELADEVSRLDQSTSIIYCSGYTEDALLHHQVTSMSRHFIAKPFSRRDLLLLVRQVLDGRLKPGGSGRG
jgi:PAS domain S-box-containing protein